MKEIPLRQSAAIIATGIAAITVGLEAGYSLVEASIAEMQENVQTLEQCADHYRQSPPLKLSAVFCNDTVTITPYVSQAFTNPSVEAITEKEVTTKKQIDHELAVSGNTYVGIATFIWLLGVLVWPSEEDHLKAF